MSVLIQYKVVIIGVWFILFFCLERIFVAAPNAVSAPVLRLVKNFSLFILVSLASPLVVLPIAAWAHNHALWSRPDWAYDWVGSWSIIVDILILDLFTYWVHRAYHVVPLMWRLHAPHHFDEHLDASSAIRFHVGEVVLSGLMRAPVFILLAIPFSHVVIFETLLLMGAIFHHSNVRIPGSLERVLVWLIVTPSHHWVHHHAIRQDTDSNYGGIFSFWDRLFGSKSSTLRKTEMKIGVEGIEDKGLLALLLSPLDKRT